MTKAELVAGFELQHSPLIVVAAIRGKWLLKHSTPSWRIKDPKKGFQRVVREERAQQIAINVLDQGRTFPNSIVLATNLRNLTTDKGQLRLPSDARFLIVDGQHRLWAQNFATYEATYACIIHLGLTEVQMAQLFLEINDNQKRVPASLRWDLVRLVRPDDDPLGIQAADLVFALATDPQSALYQRVDLTGEQGEIDLKQASIAPEIKSIVSGKKGGFRGQDYEQHYEALLRFLAAVQTVEPDGWKSGQSQLAKARVLRALLRLLPDIAEAKKKPAYLVSTAMYRQYLEKIDTAELSPEKIRAVQGSAGIREIYDLLRRQTGLA
jgi:DGQHR domain-containing protein